MFTDIHAHIICGIDDGCKNIDESIFLLKQAVENQVENIILTPHFDCESQNLIEKEEILKKIDFLNLKIKENDIKIKVFPGMEVKISPKLGDILKNAKYLLTLMDKNKYILIEAPFLKMPPNFEDIVFKIKLAGLIPVLAHPERNSEVRDNYNLLKKPKEEGLLVQINASSIVDKRNNLSYKSALELLKKDMVDFIASDCHYMKGRYSNFLDAYKVLRKVIGQDRANKIAVENPKKILNNEDFGD